MKCDDVKLLLDEYLEGSLPAGDAARVKEHLGKCADCRGELQFLRKYLKKMEKFPALKAPDDLLENIHRKIDAPARSALVSKLFFPLKIKVPLEAAALLALAVTGLLIFKPFGPEMAESEYHAEGPGRPLAMEDTASTHGDREGSRGEKPSAVMEKARKKSAGPVMDNKVASRATDMVASELSLSEQKTMEQEKFARGGQAEVTLYLKQNLIAGAEQAKEESLQDRDLAGETRAVSRKSLGYARKDKAAPEGAMQTAPSGSGTARVDGIETLARSLNGTILRKTSDGSQVIVEIPRSNYSRFMSGLRGEWSVQKQHPAAVPAGAARVQVNINIQN